MTAINDRPDLPKRITTKKFKFIGCEIIYREACHLAATTPNRVDIEFLKKGLHDLKTDEMVDKIQSTIDAVDADSGYEAILLGYARCNNGLVGVRSRNIPLVIPRAHDCITFFFGSHGAFMRYHDSSPGTSYMTTGWTERNIEEGNYDRPAYGRQGVMSELGLTQSYEEMVAKYGADNAEYIKSMLSDWKKNYTHCLYLEMGVCDEKPFIDEARRCAQENNWQFQLQDGDWTLLEKLFSGQWDEDFVIVKPGQKIIPRNDDRILDVE